MEGEGIAEADGGDDLQHILVHGLFGQDQIGGFIHAAVPAEAGLSKIAGAVRRGRVGDAQKFLPLLEQSLADFRGDAEIQRPWKRCQPELLLKLRRDPIQRQESRTLADPADDLAAKFHVWKRVPV